MSKVICDVCGTTYPETASTCPICGCAKNTTAQTAADSSQQGDANSYTYVKGGRFSKSNVRKRNNKSKEAKRVSEQKSNQDDSTNKGLVIVVLILLLAIVAVLIYIGARFLSPGSDPDPSGTGSHQTTTDPLPSGSSGLDAPIDIVCTDIKLSATNIELSEQNAVWQLSVEVTPVDTTDAVTFTSSNEQVAAVDEKGNITAVGGGEAVITVTCGSVTAECKVLCTFADPSQPTTSPTEPTVTVPPGFQLKLNRKDFTLSNEGESWTLFKETDGVKASDITWISENPEVAVVEDGKVTGVDYGDTKITATIGDQTVSCTVRVRFRAANTGGNEDGEGGETTAKYTLSDKDGDVTIKVGETFMLTLTDSEGVKMNVEWTASEEGFVTIDGSRITGLQDTTAAGIKITGTYDGETFTCIVRVRTPKTEE